MGNRKQVRVAASGVRSRQNAWFRCKRCAGAISATVLAAILTAPEASFAQDVLYKPSSASPPRFSFVKARSVFHDCKALERRDLKFPELDKVNLSDDAYQLAFKDGKSTSWLNFNRLSEPIVLRTGSGAEPRFAIKTSSNTATGSYTLMFSKGGSLEHAKQCADAVYALSIGAPLETAQQLAAFEEEARRYRDTATKPALPEELRKLRIEAELAIREKRFEDAADRYEEALRAAPWWPDGHFNRALVLAELGWHAGAARSIKKYLALVPQASDARAAQDRMYEWESKARR